MKVLVVDDEPLARARLRRLLSEQPGITGIVEADNGIDALNRVAEQRPDTVLLDIRMPGMDGIEVAHHLCTLPVPPAVVFTTAYDEHALAAFEARAVDYLLKPVRRERLAEALSRARQLNSGLAASLNANEGRARSHISATTPGGLALVAVDDVRCLLAEHKYVTVVHPQGELLVEESLRALEEEFRERFLRVHRNALVATEHLLALERGDDGHHHAVLSDVSQRPAVSRRLFPEVRRRLRQL